MCDFWVLLLSFNTSLLLLKYRFFLPPNTSTTDQTNNLVFLFLRKEPTNSSILLFSLLEFMHLHSPVVEPLQTLPRYFPTKIFFYKQNESTTRRTACFCLQCLLLLISLPHSLTPTVLSCPSFPLSLYTLFLRNSSKKFFFFLSPKHGAKTHGSCAASLLGAKWRPPVHDNKGRMWRLTLGAVSWANIHFTCTGTHIRNECPAAHAAMCFKIPSYRRKMEQQLRETA